MVSNKERLVREMLTRLADRWSLLVIEELDPDEPVRFSRLRQRLPGVSQKMLTQTLRRLERDGLVTRRVHATVPPQVEYRLTPLGAGLGEAVCGMWQWADAHVGAVERARRAYDAARGPRSASG
jgi:DNA-binding HxlR family transcriptional regulator